MRVSSIPDDVARFKPCKCSRIRNDNGVYRVYKYSAVKLPSGKWSSNYGYLIGKIIPGEGFVPNKRYQMELSKNSSFEYTDGITDVCYGSYALMVHLTQEILELLKKCFTLDKAVQIYCYAVILCVNGFIHMDQVDDYFQESYLSILYRKYSIKLGYTAVSNLLHDLGARGGPIQKFEQTLIDTSTKNIAIDGHVIRSCSTENNLAEPGYKMRELKNNQINVLIAYDIQNKIPLMYRTYRGSSVDKKSVEDLLISRSFKNTKFMVDRGFYSETVLDLMSKNGNCYIIPLSNNNRHLKRIKATLQYSSGEFVYKAGRKSSSRIVYHEEQIDEKTRILVYKDIDENNAKRKSYKQLMDAGESNYTQEKYDQYCEWWGVYFLETTAPDPASDIYSDYKGRWSIETYNNYIKNYGDFNDLKVQDYYIQHGLDFMMLVTGLLHERLNATVRSMKKSSLSTFDLLLKAGHMRMVIRDNHWKLHNTRTKDLELLKSIGFVPENNIPCDQ